MATLTNEMLMKLSSAEVAELCRKATEIAGYFIYNAENQEESGKRWTIDNWEKHIGGWTANHKKQELVQTFQFLNGLVAKKCLRKESIPFIFFEVKEMIEKLEIKDGVADLLQKIEELDQNCAKSGTALDGLSAKIEGLEGDQLKTELMKVINETKALTSENQTALMKNLDKVFAPNEEALKICKELASKLQIELPTQNPMNEKREWKMKIDKNIQKFNGNLNENWDDWIFQVDNFEKFNEIKETDMLGMVIPLLKGNALTLLKRDLTANPGLLTANQDPVILTKIMVGWQIVTIIKAMGIKLLVINPTLPNQVLTNQVIATQSIVVIKDLKVITKKFTLLIQRKKKILSVLIAINQVI